ncbi:hypothetical protein ISS42_02525 [Candidatus Shapirobacteria bacterium]|nr:hypothetical protein [Candidatus Shapirobacteria bacterium]
MTENGQVETLSAIPESRLLEQLDHPQSSVLFRFVTAYIISKYNALTYPDSTDSKVRYQVKKGEENRKRMDQQIEQEAGWEMENLESLEAVGQSIREPLAVFSQFIAGKSAEQLSLLSKSQKNQYQKRLAHFLEDAIGVTAQYLWGSGNHFGKDESTVESFFIPKVGDFPELFDLDKGGVNLRVDNLETGVNGLRARLFPAVQIEEEEDLTTAGSLNCLATGLRRTPEILVEVGEIALFLADQVQKYSDVVAKSLGAEKVRLDCFDPCLFIVSALACPHDLIPQRMPFQAFRNFSHSADDYDGRVRGKGLEESRALLLWKTTRAFLVYNLINELEKSRVKSPKLDQELNKHLFPDKEREKLQKRRLALREKVGDLVAKMKVLKREIAKIDNVLVDKARVR